MTSVVLYKHGSYITGFLSEGHSGAGEYGNDIVCSALSSAAIMTANTVTEVLKLNAKTDVRDGFLSLTVGDYKPAQQILRGFELHLKQLEQQYPQNITVSYQEVE